MYITRESYRGDLEFSEMLERVPDLTYGLQLLCFLDGRHR